MWKGDGKLSSEIGILTFFRCPSFCVFHDEIAFLAGVGAPFGRVAGEESVQLGNTYDVRINKFMSSDEVLGLCLVDKSPEFDGNGVCNPYDCIRDL